MLSRSQVWVKRHHTMTQLAMNIPENTPFLQFQIIFVLVTFLHSDDRKTIIMVLFRIFHGKLPNDIKMSKFGHHMIILTDFRPKTLTPTPNSYGQNLPWVWYCSHNYPMRLHRVFFVFYKLQVMDITGMHFISEMESLLFKIGYS